MLPTYNPRPAILLLITVGVYGLAITLVISQGPAPMVDEWVYITAAEEFALAGRIVVPSASVAPSIFEAAAGGTLLRLVGGSTTTLVVFSAVLSGLGGWALWDILYRAGVSAELSSFGALAFLFTGVFFALSATYMTDAHAISLALIATALYGIAVRGTRAITWLFLLASVIVAAGYLSRPSVLAVSVAVSFWAFKNGRGRDAILASSIPIATFVIHASVVVFGGTSVDALGIAERLALPSIRDMVSVASTSAIVVAVWAFPWTGLSNALSLTDWKPRAMVAGLLCVVAGFGSTILYGDLPAVGDWMNPDGLFPISQSTIGTRPSLIGPVGLMLGWVLVVLIAGLVIGFLFQRRTAATASISNVALWAFAWASLATVLITVIPRFGWVLDRYLAPFLPALILSLAIRIPKRVVLRPWSLLPLIVTVGATTVLAVDGMRTQNAILEVAELGVAMGIPAEEIDGGAVWVGFQYGFEADPSPRVSASETWWRTIFAPDVAPRYEVVLNPGTDDCEIARRSVRHLVGQSSKIVLRDTECA